VTSCCFLEQEQNGFPVAMRAEKRVVAVGLNSKFWLNASTYRYDKIVVFFISTKG